jgi:hypothetical protein
MAELDVRSTFVLFISPFPPPQAVNSKVSDPIAKIVFADTLGLFVIFLDLLFKFIASHSEIVAT